MHMRKTSTWDVNARNRRFDVRLDLTLLTAEAGSGPEADIFCKAGPHEFRGQESPGSTNTRMRELVERREQLMAERNGNQRPWRSGGHITENGGCLERDGDHGEGRVK